MALRTVRMVHEDVREGYEAPVSAVDHWRARGWRLETEKAPATKTTAAKATDEKKGGTA